jgi:predicted  nucleic acid-binding Zn-ribbon protein
LEYCIVEYEGWFESANLNVAKLQNFLNLHVQADSTLDEALREIADPALRHEQMSGPAAKEPIVRQFYELVLASGHDGAARREIHKFVAQFDGWERLHGGFYRAYEGVSASAERNPNLEAQIVELQSTITRDAENLARAGDEAAAYQTRVATLEVEREAIDARATAAELGLEQLQNEVAAYQTRVATLEVERADILAELEKSERYHADALAGVEQRAKEAAAKEASLRGEVAALVGQVSEARDRTSRADERAQLAGMETASVRDEVAALREQLHAAREVGARLIAAFRSNQCLAPAVVARRGWWSRFRRE